MSWVGAVGIRPRFVLVFSARVDDGGAPALELLGDGVDDWADEGGEEGEDEDGEGFGDFFDQGFKAGDLFDDGGYGADYFVAEFEDWVDLCDGFFGVEVWHAGEAGSWGSTLLAWRGIELWIGSCTRLLCAELALRLVELLALRGVELLALRLVELLALRLIELLALRLVELLALRLIELLALRLVELLALRLVELLPLVLVEMLALSIELLIMLSIELLALMLARLLILLLVELLATPLWLRKCRTVIPGLTLEIIELGIHSSILSIDSIRPTIRAVRIVHYIDATVESVHVRVLLSI
jgi:hypothetical protein